MTQHIITITTDSDLQVIYPQLLLISSKDNVSWNHLWSAIIILHYKDLFVVPQTVYRKLFYKFI